MGNTAIPWATKVWSVLHGCSHASSACDHCWAEREAVMRIHNPLVKKHYVGTIRNGRWTGRVNFIESRLDEPKRWKAPQVVFVASSADLFHPNVPFEWVQRIVEAQNDAPQHTYLWLTKRPERMAKFVKNYFAISPGPNVWLGVTVENNDVASIRLPILFDIPAAKHFISAEPLLGRLDVFPYAPYWIICGAESGPGARPINTDWVRGLRDQCTAMRIPFMYKQGPDDSGRFVKEPLLDGKRWMENDLAS